MWPFRSPQQPSSNPDSIRAYDDAVSATAAMVNDSEAHALAARHGLAIVNVAWEDTARFKGSCVGPNISDLTLQVQSPAMRGGGDRLTLMPAIRFPNFSDRSGDIPLDRFFVRVGNEKGRALRRVSLRDVLGDLRTHLHEPSSWSGSRRSLLAPRDTHAIVSAQACFLPLPREGTARFNPVLFNYQSVAGDPAVLTLVATREGTSVTVIDNVRDAHHEGPAWGQRLFFNQDGERASLTAQRRSDFRANALASGDADALREADEGSGLDLVLIVQVPLKQRPRPPARYAQSMAMPACAPGGMVCERTRKCDVEEAVVGHGEVEGPFTEIDGLAIERDERYPIRVTVQFYRATSNGVIDAPTMATIAKSIERVYRDADFVGSLVTEGATSRPTEYHGPKSEPVSWWDEFWARHEANTGESRARALARIRGQLGGRDPSSADEAERLLRNVGF